MSDPRPPTAPSIEELRTALGDKLDELKRRAVHAKELLAPVTHLGNPWVLAGIGLALGILAGRRRGATTVVHVQDSLVRSVVRAGLGAAVSAIVTRTLALPPGEE